MIKTLITGILLLMYSGCQKKENSSEKIVVIAEEKPFLETVVVNGISYRDDNLTPDVAEGKLFGDWNATVEEPPSHFFVFEENRSDDQVLTKLVKLDPIFLLEVESYTDRNLRISQIMSFRELPKLRPPKKRSPTVKKVVEEEDLRLPEGLLPPKIPRIPIHIDVPDFPGF